MESSKEQKFEPPIKGEYMTGEKFRVYTPEKGAIKIQATWRRKSTQKRLNVMNLSAVSIQKFVRGFIAREQTLPQIANLKEKKLFQKAQNERLKKIKSKEKDILILDQLGAEKYIAYEQIKKNSSAKVIQKFLSDKISSKKGVSASTRLDFKSHARKSGHPKIDATKKSTAKQKEVENQPKIEETRNYQIIKEIMFQLHEKNKERMFSPRQDGKETSALGLSQLYSRIRIDADKRQEAQRKELENAMPNRQWSHGSLRHKYSDLIELQQKADVLLNEFYSTKDLLDEKKAERKKTLKNCNQFLQDLQNIPNFPESIDYFTKPEIALKNKTMTNWLYNTETMNILEESRSLEENHRENILSKSIKNHLNSVDVLLNSKRWDSILLPINNEFVSAEKELLNNLQKPTSLKNLANQWKNGDDVEESLPWITYALQPSRLQESDAPCLLKLNDSTKLLFESLSNPKKRMEFLMNKSNQAHSKVDALSKAISQDLWVKAKEEIFSKASDSRLRDAAKFKLLCVIKIQSWVRAYIARMRVKELRSQRRIMEALHNLMDEIAQSEKDHLKRKGKGVSKGQNAVVDPGHLFSLAKNIQHSLKTPHYESSAKNPPASSSSVSAPSPMINSSIDKMLGSLPKIKEPINKQMTPHRPADYKLYESKLTPRDSKAELTSTTISSSLNLSWTPKRPTSILSPLPSQGNSTNRKFYGIPSEEKFSNLSTSFIPHETTTSLGPMDESEVPLLDTPVGKIKSAIRSPRPELSTEADSKKKVEFSQQQKSLNNVTSNMSSVQSSTSSTPQTRQFPSTPPSSARQDLDTSELLSPFLEMPYSHEKEDPGYISSPGQSSNSLSRSLSVSFGKVSDVNTKSPSSARPKQRGDRLEEGDDEDDM